MCYSVLMFKPGDVVTLKSGGPKMTVSWVEGNEVGCVWFDGPKEQGSSFKVAVLQLSEQPQTVSGQVYPRG